jgi:hypothetical protein
MTEAEWLAGNDSDTIDEMWEAVSGESDRKLRLFAVAMCRQLDDEFHAGFRDERSRNAVEVAERYADGLATDDELAEACLASNRPEVRADGPTVPNDGDGAFRYYAAEAATKAAMMPPDMHDSHREAIYALDLIGDDDARPRGEELLRDIFGNPFRPTTFSPEWRTDTTLSLARQMYDSREFYAMPILADALQDAGCDTEDILAHCRDPKATHVRGCWVCDLVLGKE